MKHFLICILIACSFAMTAAHAATCYTPEQYRAEQAVRFHTNLMVMGLYCKGVMKQNTYATYQNFTRRNQNVIKTEENRLISYFRQAKKPSPEKQLHTMRTDLANKTSMQAGQSVVAFCRKYTPYYERSKTMIPADFQRWIAQINLRGTEPSTLPLCGAAQRGK